MLLQYFSLKVANSFFIRENIYGFMRYLKRNSSIFALFIQYILKYGVQLYLNLLYVFIFEKLIFCINQLNKVNMNSTVISKRQFSKKP